MLKQEGVHRDDLILHYMTTGRHLPVLSVWLLECTGCLKKPVSTELFAVDPKEPTQIPQHPNLRV